MFFTHPYVYTNICVSACVYVHICVYVYIYACMSVCLYACMSVYLYVCVYSSMCMCVYVCVCYSVFLYVRMSACLIVFMSVCQVKIIIRFICWDCQFLILWSFNFQYKRETDGRVTGWTKMFRKKYYNIRVESIIISTLGWSQNKIPA